MLSACCGMAHDVRMANVGEMQSHGAGNTAEFAAAMRQLKEHSGLTYRQLEELAAEHGEVLARSTLADVLGGKTAPRPELVAAFVRACGDGARVREWLEARERAVSSVRGQGEDEAESGTPGRRTRRGMGLRRVPALLLGLAVLTLVAATAWGVGLTSELAGSGGRAAVRPRPWGTGQSCRKVPWRSARSWRAICA